MPIPSARKVGGAAGNRTRVSCLHGSCSTKAKAEDRKQMKKKHCRYFQQGNCTRRECQFANTTNVCMVFSRLGEGECPDGNYCDKSHPVQICEKWMEGGCMKGNKCAMQHPGKTGSGSGSHGSIEKRANGNQRRGSQSQASFPGQNLQNDCRLNYVQQQQGYQNQPYVQQHAPQMPPNTNLYQVPPPQPMNLGQTHGIRYANYRYQPINYPSFLWKGASLLDPGVIGQVQDLLQQQQAGPGHQVFQQHQQGGRPRNGGYLGQWN